MTYSNRLPFVAGQPMMIFTMGILGSGKSTWCRRQLPSQQIIAADAFKRSHPAFDPAQSDRLHPWSKVMAARLFDAVLAQGRGLWVLEGIGANAAKLDARIGQAKTAGFATVLVYFPCRLDLALARNLQRIRTIPETIIQEKASTIDDSFRTVAPGVDYVLVQNCRKAVPIHCQPSEILKPRKNSKNSQSAFGQRQ